MWTDHLIAVIWGPPIAMGRHRCSKHGRPYLPEKSRAGLKKNTFVIAAAMRDQEIWLIHQKIPISVELVFVHPRPKNMRYSDKRTPKTTKPDLDNLIKMIMDSCSRANVWHDDNQITQVTAHDFYASSSEQEAKTIIKVCYWQA